MSGEKKAKGWRFYGLVGFGAIALLSAGVWALQYAGSGPKKTLSPLVVHNNLQIDLNEPDLFLDSDSLSQLPKDLLTIPFHLYSSRQTRAGTVPRRGDSGWVSGDDGGVCFRYSGA